MFERFTDLARRVVVLAQEEARLLNHDYIGTEHLLLGLLHEDRGLARQALTELDVSLDAVREQVTTIIGTGERTPTGHIPFTPRAKKVLELALREALQLGTDYIGTEHLLLGLIREGQGVAAQVLAKLGKSLDEVRQTVIRLYEEQSPEEREQQQNRPTGERVREREEPSVFEPRFPMPGFLQRRPFVRGATARAGREFAEYTPVAAPRAPVRASDPVARRPAEAERLLVVLARRERNNALLVGPSGCGKSALVRDLAQTLGANRGPASLGSAEVVELDVAALRAGVDRIVRRSASPVVLIEDLDMLLRADDLSGGRVVTAVASLAESEAPLIVTASAEARDRFEQGFPTLATRFESVELAAADPAHTLDVLELLRPGLQDFHGITIADSALAAAVELAPRVPGGRVPPGGAVDLLDAAAARLAVRDGTNLEEGHLRDAA
ncbi:MAG TPA: Clp protease N-terminal domain-containing protein [Actinospica sp.]|jgi:ATP-dependent Clp protease ATP-binding subunit ClpC|nr:Clp protease N-terminal domain-containing protein [Actinospica sp.]